MQPDRLEPAYRPGSRSRLHDVAPTGKPEPAAPGAAHGRLQAQPVDWASSQVLYRSVAGVHGGVWFLRDQARTLAVKNSSTAVQDLFLAHLAHRLGLLGPAVGIDHKVPPHVVREVVGSGRAEKHWLVMARVEGQSFADLLADDRPRFVGDKQGSLLFEVGRVIAFDYLIGNPDRFPCAGLEACNPGNLMVDAQGIQVIDSTLPKFILAPEVARFQRKLNEVLALVSDAHDARAAEHLRPVLEFFPASWHLTWADVGTPLVAGFRHQARAIGQRGEAELAQAATDVGAHGRIDRAQMETLRDQARMFHRALAGP